MIYEKDKGISFDKIAEILELLPDTVRTWAREDGMLE